LETAARARLERANRDKELKHKLEFVGLKDDGGAPDKNALLQRDLVQNDGVFALVAGASPGWQNASFLEQEKVPFVGWGFASAYCDQKYGFGYTGCLVADFAKTDSTGIPEMLAKELGGAKGVRLAIVGQNDESAKQGQESQARAAKDVGFDVVYAKSTLPSQTQAVGDLTPYAQEILDAKPDFVVDFVSLPYSIALISKLRALGYKGKNLSSGAYVPGVLNTPAVASALADDYVVLQGFGAQEFGGPQWDQVKKDLEAVKKGSSGEITLGTTAGYGSADLFIAIAKKLEKSGKPFTAENFAKAGANFKYQGMGNVINQVSFPTAKHELNSCFALVQIKGTAYQPVSDLACYGAIPKK
jgi:ABC-type branched-subunit amino acid transport system substrate-binding protein